MVTDVAQVTIRGKNKLPRNEQSRRTQGNLVQPNSDADDMRGVHDRVIEDIKHDCQALFSRLDMYFVRGRCVTGEWRHNIAQSCASEKSDMLDSRIIADTDTLSQECSNHSNKAEWKQMRSHFGSGVEVEGCSDVSNASGASSLEALQTSAARERRSRKN